MASFRRYLKAALLLFAAFPFLQGCTEEGPPPPVEEKPVPVRQQLQRYPASTAQDLYKLVYQAALGPGHYFAEKSYDEILSQLSREAYAIMRPAPGDTIAFEPIGQGHVRVHLAPYLANGGSFRLLADAIVNSCQRHDSLAFLEQWDLIWGMAYRDELVHLELKDIQHIDSLARVENYPAFHHSPAYLRQYRPHYRVITTSQADSLLHYIALRRQGLAPEKRQLASEPADREDQAPPPSPLPVYGEEDFVELTDEPGPQVRLLPETATSRIDFRRITLAPGGEVVLESVSDERYYYILEGSLRYTAADGRSRDAASGEMIWVSEGSSCTLINASASDVIILVVTSSP